MDEISKLLPELAKMIFCYLSPSDIRNAQIVSDKWAEIMEDPNFCRKMCGKNNVVQVDQDKQSLRWEQFIENYEESHIYQAIWEYYLKLDLNWLEKPFDLAKNFSFSRLYAYQDIVYLDEKIMVVVKSNHRQNCHYYIEIQNNYNMKTIDRFRIPSSWDKCLNISRQCNLLVVGITFRNYTKFTVIVRNIVQRTNVWKTYFNSTIDQNLPRIIYFQMAVNEKLMAVEISCAKLISIMNLNDGKVKFNLKCEDPVVYLKFYKGKLVVIKGVINQNIQIWDIEKQTVDYLFASNMSLAVSWVMEQLEEYMVFSAYSAANVKENTVHVFNLNQNRFLYTTQCQAVLPLLVKNYRMVYAETFQCLKMKNCHDGELITTINDNEDVFYALNANSKFLVSISQKTEHGPICKFKIFDFYTGNFLRSVNFTDEVISVHSIKLMKAFLLTEALAVIHYNKNFDRDVLNSEIFYLNFDV